jgi:hypothetical protein
VKHFHYSTIASEKLKSTQRQLNPNGGILKLKMDVPTRWNSTYYMFERVIKIKEPVEAALGMLHNPVPMLTADEWKIVKQINQILKPFEQMSRELSSEKYVSISKVIPMVNGADCSQL